MKQGKRILNILGEIDEKYIEEAEPIKRIGRKYSWIKWGGLVASIALIMAVGIHRFKGESDSDIKVVQKQPQETISSTADLPMLSIAEHTDGDMGFEGYMAYKVSELVSNNPWNEKTQYTTMPVYKNQLTFDEQYQATNPNWEAMKEFLLNVATRLGLKKEELVITDDAPDEEQKSAITDKFAAIGETAPEEYFAPREVIGEAEGIKISISADMTADIEFEPAIKLPGKYHFKHYTTYNEIQKVAKYLKKKYDKFIDMENPETNIYGGDYSYDGDQSYGIEFFDSGKKSTEDIINYNFNRVAFYCDDDGKLFITRIWKPDLSSKVADYPIITTEEAEKMLLSGKYMTTVHYKMPGEKYIAKVELIYRTGQYEKYYMPYYRFYIEIPKEKQKNGLKTYGAYYVPAVESKYISNIPVWNGSFN